MFKASSLLGLVFLLCICGCTIATATTTATTTDVEDGNWIQPVFVETLSEVQRNSAEDAAAAAAEAETETETDAEDELLEDISYKNPPPPPTGTPAFPTATPASLPSGAPKVPSLPASASPNIPNKGGWKGRRKANSGPAVPIITPIDPAVVKALGDSNQLAIPHPPILAAPGHSVINNVQIDAFIKNTENLIGAYNKQIQEATSWATAVREVITNYQLRYAQVTTDLEARSAKLEDVRKIVTEFRSTRHRQNVKNRLTKAIDALQVLSALDPTNAYNGLLESANALKLKTDTLTAKLKETKLHRKLYATLVGTPAPSNDALAGLLTQVKILGNPANNAFNTLGQLYPGYKVVGFNVYDNNGNPKGTTGAAAPASSTPAPAPAASTPAASTPTSSTPTSSTPTSSTPASSTPAASTPAPAPASTAAPATSTGAAL